MKSIARKKREAKAKASNAENATVNRAGGVAFDIADPALKLVTMTGGSFFAEPSYYSGDAIVAARNSAGKGASLKEKFGKLEQRLQIVDGKLDSFASCEELDDVAREVVATAMSVAETNTPADLLAIANWLRNEANIRLTPQVLLVIASRCESTKSLVRKYAPHIIVRPDEVKTCLMMHRFFFGYKSLANGLAWGLCDALSKFGERGLLKYDGSSFPTWKDVLEWLPRKNGKPLSSPLAKYFITGEIVDEDATPVIAARKKLSKCTKFNDEAKALAKKSLVNWEVLNTQFGVTAEGKKAVWEYLLDNDLLGYMALLRNLRNLHEANVSAAHVKKACDKLSNADEVRKSRQLPFRFLMAHQIVEGLGGDSRRLGKFTDAIAQASNHACENLFLPGLTVIMADNSASMDQTVSSKSQMTCSGAANSLCGIVAKASDDAYVISFGESMKEIPVSKNTDTVIDIAKKVKNARVGHSTNAYLVVEWMIRNKIVADRVILLSDMQCWDSRGWYSDKSVCDVWAKYKRIVKGSSKTWFHSIDLAGYGDNPLDSQGNKVNLVGGFSEKILPMLLESEGVVDGEAPDEAKAVPTVEQIREKWSV
jgi:hypothetical protein